MDSISKRKTPSQRIYAAVETKNTLKYISPDFELFVRNANEEKPLALRAGKVQRTSGCISGQERGADKYRRTLDQGLVARSGVRRSVAKDTQGFAPRPWQIIDAVATMSAYKLPEVLAGALVNILIYS